MSRRSRQHFVLVAVTAVALVACGGPPEGPPKEPPAGPAVTFGDADLANAELLPVENASVAPGDLDVAIDGRLEGQVVGGDEAPPLLGDGPGYLAVVERDADTADHRVLLYEDAEEFGTPRVVFEGSTEVQSVAVNLDGDIVLLSAASDSEGFEAYVLDLVGAFGPTGTAYRLPGTPGDELDVSMSNDGRVWAHATEDSGGVGNAVVYFANLVSGVVERKSMDIAIGGNRYPMYEPSLSGDGSMLAFGVDTSTHYALQAPVIVAFSTTGGAGAIVWEGSSISTSHLGAPSLSFDAGLLAFEETWRDVQYVRVKDLVTDDDWDVIENDEKVVDHPHLSPTGDTLVYSLDGTVHRATLTLDKGDAVITPTPVSASVAGATGLAAYIASAAPTPSLPQGAVTYEGTTAGGNTWNRPSPPEPTTEGPVGYHAETFTAATNGVYSIESVQDYDGYLLVYENGFDPDNPYDGLVAFNDDDPEPGFSRLLVPLATGEHVIVTTGWGPGDEGRFSNTIVPPREPDPEHPPFIELMYTDATVVGTGEALTLSWYAASALPVTCEVDWGDGTVESESCGTESLQVASHTYGAEGPYTVTVTVANANGWDQAKVLPTVHDDDPNAFDIVVVFANDQLSPSQFAAFEDAADRWSEVLAGDLPPGQPAEVPANLSCAGEPAFNGPIDDLVISASGEYIDGPGQILGQAGPCLFRKDGTNGDLAPLPLYGFMRFDSADLDDLEDGGGLLSTIVHEMGHVLGIGTLWEDNGLLDHAPAGPCDTQGSFTSPPVFTGTSATAQHGVIGGDGHPLVEDEFSPGTRCGHWDEHTYESEIMTGFAEATGPEQLSVMTVGSLEDLGYAVDLAAADPFSVPVARTAAVDEDPSGYDEILVFPKYR